MTDKQATAIGFAIGVILVLFVLYFILKTLILAVLPFVLIAFVAAAAFKFLK